MATLVLRKGQTVETNDGRSGLIQYIGSLEVSPGEWCGLELPDASGKNDGSVKGNRYFTCEPGHGIFVRKENVVRIVKQPVAAAPVSRSNGQPVAPGTAAVKSRPSSIMVAETARKRQSLMSNSSGSQPGSRLSTRSPTKSPSKGARSSISSTASTPRTTTPATTARTSDSSAKSRLSTAGKPASMTAPPSEKPVTAAPRTSIANPMSAMRTEGSMLGSTSASRATSRLSVAAQSRSGSGTSLATSPAPVEEQSEHEPGPEAEAESVLNHDDTSIEDKPLETSAMADEQEQLEPPTVEQPPNEKTPIQSPAMKVRPRASLAASDTRSTRTASTSRTNGLSQNSVKATNQREVDELKVKIKTLERKRQEDRDELKQIETLKSEKDRYAKVAETLQKKLKANQEEIKSLKARCEEAEQRANSEPEMSAAEFESRLELAHIDRDMAQERFDGAQSELELLKSQNDELMLEAEILRDENKELTSTINPEERSSLGWLQMEKENDRLREALIVLRDHAKESENTSSGRIKELERDLENAEDKFGKWLETSEEAKRLKDTNAHLLEQLEAAESQEDVVADMMQERDKHLAQIEGLRSTLSELEELAQTNQDLENFYVENERGLLSKLDEQEALLNDRERQSSEQDRVIEDLEYTLNKFREVVSGLQSDIDEARRSRDISELQAHEMTNKSKAMMDLNLRLQNTASKSQTKLIDVELVRIQAGVASKQTEILSLFLPESFDSERNAILAYLTFTKIKSRAGLIASVLSDRLRERSHLISAEETISGFEVVDIIYSIEATADRFERFMSSCSSVEFAAFGSAPAELDPVDRALAGWVDALRRDELGSDGAEHLRRMHGILADLAEKLIPATPEAKATELVAIMQMAQNHAEVAASVLASVMKFTQARLGKPQEDEPNEEYIDFDRKIDQLGTRARTARYVSDKVIKELEKLRSQSLCLGENIWQSAEDVEQAVRITYGQVNGIASAISQRFNPDELDGPVSYSSLLSILSSASSENSHDGTVFEDLMTSWASAQGKIDNTLTKTADLSTAIEFETAAAPWTIRARDLKSQTQSTIPASTQEELTNLQRRSTEILARLSDRERTIEEMTIRVELAEKREQRMKINQTQDEAYKDQIQSLETEKAAALSNVTSLETEKSVLQAQLQDNTREIELLRQSITTDSAKEIAASSTNGAAPVDEASTKYLQTHLKALHSEIVNLQALVRHLREENTQLAIPISEVRFQTAQNSWLDPGLLAQRKTRSTAALHKESLRRETNDVYDGLLDVVKALKPVQLRDRQAAERQKTADKDTDNAVLGTTTSWQARALTTKYKIAKQREQIEQWESWRNDLVKRVAVTTRTGAGAAKRREKKAAALPPLPSLGLPVDKGGGIDGGDGGNYDVEIVET